MHQNLYGTWHRRIYKHVCKVLSQHIHKLLRPFLHTDIAGALDKRRFLQLPLHFHRLDCRSALFQECGDVDILFEIILDGPCIKRQYSGNTHQ